jgi:regulator of protease activity HflC (stomatin/prohibitin superfamily)
MTKKVVAGIIISVAFILFLIINPMVIVKAGYRGVVTNWGAVSDKVLNEGIHWVVPIKQQVHKMDVRTQKIEVEVATYSKDIQTVNSKIALNYHLLPEGVNNVYQKVGTNFVDTIIQPAIQESVKAITAQFNAQELIEERPKVKEGIKTSLKDRLSTWNISVDEFSIANFDFSDEYEKAVEQKQVAQQNALKAKNDLDRIKTEAEQRVAQARAEAEAIKLQSEAANNDKYVQLKALEVQMKAIEKWKGEVPAAMIPGGAVPFLNVIK